MYIICKRFMESLVVICLWLVAGPAMAATPFSITGHIQSFTLDSPADVFSSAKMVVNGITVTLPRNTVVFLPANLLTPQQLFDQAPTGGTTPAGTSGLAFGERGSLNDQPFSSYEVAIDGNIVGGVYIAGLVQLHNEFANISSGFIRSIDYGTGELCVGASSVPLGPGVSCAPPDMRVRLNDPPESRYSGSANQPSPDVRFTVDQDNPTIHAKTGYPICVPNVDPALGVGVDPKCPDTNRPRSAGVALTTFVMSGPTIPATAPGAFPRHPTIVSCSSLTTNPNACDPDQQAPVLVGDFLDTISGTLFNDGTSGHPFYISAHTINANLGIYTRAAASTPAGASKTAYVDQVVSLIGTNGPDSICAITAECQSKIRIVGFMTDPTRLFQLGLYAVDVDAFGVHRTRKLPVPLILQAVFGRFRFESRVNQVNLLVPGKGATREYMVRIDTPAPLPDGSIVPTADNRPDLRTANGLIAGQYVAPMNLYIFPEALVLGAPPPPNNFQCLAFLTAGWTTASVPGFIGQLNPWPGLTTPAASAAGVNCSN